jgi:hypothetical protein
MIENSTPQNIDSFLLEFVRFSNYAHRSPYSDIITQQESFLRNDIAHADYVMSINSTTMKRLIDTIDKISQRVMAAMKR